METGETSTGKILEVDRDMNKTVRDGNFRGNARTYQNFGRLNSRGEYRSNYRDENYSRNRGRDRSGVYHYYVFIYH